MKNILLLNILLLLIGTFSVQSCAKKEGCTNPLATNYDPEAEVSTANCIIPGCTDPSSENYNPDATTNDGSCIIKGCMDVEAINYNADATTDDGSCRYRKDLFIGTYLGTTECDNALINDAIGGMEMTFRIIEIVGEINKVTVEVDFNTDILEEDPVGTIDEENILSFMGSQKEVEIDILGSVQKLDVYIVGTFTLDEATMDILSGTMNLKAYLSSTPDVLIIESTCVATAQRQ